MGFLDDMFDAFGDRDDRRRGRRSPGDNGGLSGLANRLRGRSQPGATQGRYGDDRGARGGYGRQDYEEPRAGWGGQSDTLRGGSAMNDSASLERYRYLLRTGSPDQIEAMHVEAFGKLNPEQRERLADALAAQAQPGEAPRSSDPRDLARAATRQEIRAPGSIEAAYAATNRADSRDVGSDPQRADRSGLGFGDRDIVGAVGAGALGLIGGIVAGSVISSVVGSIFDGVDFGPEAMFGDFDGGFDL